VRQRRGWCGLGAGMPKKGSKAGKAGKAGTGEKPSGAGGARQLTLEAAFSKREPPPPQPGAVGAKRAAGAAGAAGETEAAAVAQPAAAADVVCIDVDAASSDDEVPLCHKLAARPLEREEQAEAARCRDASACGGAGGGERSFKRQKQDRLHEPACDKATADGYTGAGTPLGAASGARTAAGAGTPSDAGAGARSALPPPLQEANRQREAYKFTGAAVTKKTDVLLQAWDNLKNIFRLSSFRQLQREAIEGVLSAKDVVVCLATGGGKSLCYQLPGTVLPGVTVVVSPLVRLQIREPAPCAVCARPPVLRLCSPQRACAPGPGPRGPGNPSLILHPLCTRSP